MAGIKYYLSSHLGEVSALCDPERRGAETDDDGAGDEGRERWVELRGDVERVAHHGGHHGPLGGQPPDGVARHEDGGGDQRDVDDRQRDCAQAVDLEENDE